MDDGHTLTRRQFLRLSAVTAAGVVVTACSGGQANPAGAGTAGPSASTAAGGPATAAPAPAAAASAGAAAAGQAEVATSVPVTPGGKYAESPQLAALVKAGKLPPVEQRLPKNPYVAPHAWLKPGKYGGTMRWSTTSNWGLGHYVQETMYGNSPLRYLKDALEIGPGLVATWEHNADTSQWTLHFREGLKWSDGQPWSVDDILYWWNDLVQNPAANELPPDDLRSTKGTLAQLKKIDDHTLQVIFDAPVPMMADRLATWVKCGIGPRWMAPMHYLKQFHPKYTPSIKDFKQHTDKMDFAANPACPTMTGWMLKEYKEGQRTVWVRNPYYWVVDKQGNQLPFLDGITVTGYQDPQVEKVNIMAGKVDYVHGGYGSVDLIDVQQLKQAQPTSKLEVRLWDSGSGTGSIFFFNYDYAEPKTRKLIRDPKFRQALSHAFNRAEARKTIYFNTGELTTGTLSPKGFNFNINGQGQQIWQQWRDSYVTYDPERAKAMLDALGVKVGPGGKRTLPDGSPLKISLDYHSDTTKEHISKNELLAKDWQAIGIDATMNPVPPSGFETKWTAGQLMSKTDWEVGDNTPMIYAGWVVPVSTDHWAPLHAQQYLVRGTPKEKQELNVDPYQRHPPRTEAEKGGPIDRIWKLFDQARVEPNVTKRTQLEWEIMKIHITDGPFLMGVVANYPRIVLVHQDMRNVPKRDDLAQHGWVNPWIHPTPAVYDPEAYFWENPEQHT